MSTRTERWSVELVMRYVCATLVTWIAAAGAQLVVRNDFIFVVVALSGVGTLVSLYLRRHSMQIAGFSLSRPLWNSFTVIAFFVSATIWTLTSMSDLLGLILTGSSQSFWIRFGAEGSLALLMQVFLLFAAFRSFALISDKDATLATVPSFSVLLLLVPVHKGIEVVLYFLAWTLVSTMLFALDHRGELHTGTNGFIPAPQPGQDVRMAARGLFTVMGTALLAAFSLSGFLTSRNADDRSATETAITNLVGRLAQFAMNSSDSSVGGGPERQIDFSASPTMPTRALLWRVRTRDEQGNIVSPSYFRLLTMSQYNGTGWTQTNQGQKQVAASLLPLQDTYFPRPAGGGGILQMPVPASSFATPVPPEQGGPRYRYNEQTHSFSELLRQSRAQAQRPRKSELSLEDDSSIRGFSLKQVWPQALRSYGQPTMRVRARIVSSAINLGYVPLLPGTSAIYPLVGRVDDVRSSPDGAIDFGFVPQDQNLISINEVPRVPEYGFSEGEAPIKKIPYYTGAPQLDPIERKTDLRLPRLSARTLNFAKSALARASSNDNELRLAQRLAFAIQRGSTYTLHPPIPPAGRESTDFFLFDGNKRGFCTHFASSLAVLCRSQGIPARVVSGFAAQEYIDGGTALLRDANSHAWTEVWVSNWGWAPVDATPASDRGDNAPSFFSYWGDWFGFVLNQVEVWSQSRLWILGVIGAALIASVYVFRRRERIYAWWGRRRARSSTEEWTRLEIIAAYEGAASRVARLFRPRSNSETPVEWLVAASESFAHSPRPKPFARSEFEQLTQLYLKALYAPQTPSRVNVDLAHQLKRQVRRYNKKDASK